MCGIVGIATNKGWTHASLNEQASAMANTMGHRGPDDHGVWVDEHQGLAFGHRRLSIQDLSSAGHQPMHSESGRSVIVFNGEIYNFHDIAHKLRQKGHKLRGHSDTEVLLESIEEWGVESTLQRCRGMFAFSIWDRKNQELILARDRMGEKPLFFGWLNNCFIFSSELKAIYTAFKSALNINMESLAAFFRFGYVPTPHCIYQNIFKLFPGTYLRVPYICLHSVGEFNPMPFTTDFSPRPYWDVRTIAQQGVSNPITDENEAIEKLDSLLRDVIRLQKIADVPIGSFLSGGVDSTLVTSLMQAISDKPINTFSIGFKEKEYDEAPYARSIASHLKTNHHEYYISAEDGLGLIDAIPKYWDEPFADSSQIPALLIAQKARQKVTVCLTGDGGDELFCGYNRYFATAALLDKCQKLPISLRQLIANAIKFTPANLSQASYNTYKHLFGNRNTQSNVSLKIQKIADLLISSSKEEAYKYLMSYWNSETNLMQGVNEAKSILDRQFETKLDHFIHDAMLWDQIGYLCDDNLVKGDRASMAVSLETRLPFLDNQVIEFSWRLPLKMKYRNGHSKWILRQILYQYVPKQLMDRPKMGFSVPIRDWLKGPLREWANDLINSKNIIAKSNLNPSLINDIWRQHLQGSFDHSHKLWVLCMWLNWIA